MNSHNYEEALDGHNQGDTARKDSGAVMREPLLKRPMDILLSGLMILFSLPVTLPLALAIKLEDGGPIFYKQKRWGRNGSPFHSLKFRTMVPNSDRDYGIVHSRHGDKRITKTGRLMRAMGLDELPQILNIFLGEMSFVGPRPLAVGEVVTDEEGRVVEYEDVPGFWTRLRARPGMTSIATIYIPKYSSPRRKFRYDLLYLKKQSFWLDLRLILLSFWISFRGKWETMERKH